MNRSGRPMDEHAMRQCIKDCGACAAMCVQCAHHCLHMAQMGADPDHASPRHQGILRDCADACALAAGFMSRCSGYAEEACVLCAQLCLRCADDCEHLAEGDETMILCAEACRRCARSCERMVGAGV